MVQSNQQMFVHGVSPSLSYDLKERWASARVSSICKAIDQKAMDRGESELLKEVSESQRDALLRLVFDHSRALAMSFSKHYGVYLELDDLKSIIPDLGSPCLKGVWKQHNDSYVLKRSGCAFRDFGAFGCQYWKEALDGFVMGISDDVRYVRHKSEALGDEECLDILYNDVSSDPFKFKWRAVPEEIRDQLEDVSTRFKDMKVDLQFKGVAEDRLYYEVFSIDSKKPLCGAGAELIHGSIHRAFDSLKLKYTLQDISPLAVYGGELK